MWGGTRCRICGVIPQFRAIPRPSSALVPRAPSPRESKKREKDAFYESLLPLFKEEIAGKIREFKKKSGDEVFGRGDLMDATGVSPATATQMIKKLQKAKKIRPVKGQGKGKFRFR